MAVTTMPAQQPDQNFATLLLKEKEFKVQIIVEQPSIHTNELSLHGSELHQTA